MLDTSRFRELRVLGLGFVVPLVLACASPPPSGVVDAGAPAIDASEPLDADMIVITDEPEEVGPPAGEVWQARAERAADAVGRGMVTGAKAVGSGASAVGRGLATAYRGVRDGFEEVDKRGDFGPYPENYPALVRHHLVRFEGFGEDTSFRFERPEPGYLNAGLLRGGKVEWQGWLVDVEMPGKPGQPPKQRYVRIRDGMVVDVHRTDRMLRRVGGAAARDEGTTASR